MWSLPMTYFFATVFQIHVCERVAIPGLVGALGGYSVVGAFQQRHFMLVMSPLDVPCDHEELLCFVTDLVTKIFLYYGFLQLTVSYKTEQSNT